jgi:hypothetical protein
MKRRGRVLKRRYGQSWLGRLFGKGHDPRKPHKAYQFVLASVFRLNKGVSKNEVRKALRHDGIDKSTADRALAVAEKRGHIFTDRDGAYFMTEKGEKALAQAEGRGSKEMSE